MKLTITVGRMELAEPTWMDLDYIGWIFGYAIWCPVPILEVMIYRAYDYSPYFQ